VGFVRFVARIARWLAIADATAAVLLVLALYDNGEDVLVAVVPALPAGVLFLFSTALFEAAELPGRLRNAPAEARDLRTAVDELGRARGTRLPGALWRTGRRASSARDLVMPWAPLLPLISIPFLLATLISAVLTPFVLLGTLAALAAQL
jgi:hypothetical protein